MDETEMRTLARAYLDAIEAFDRTQLERVLNPDFVQTEHPNQLVPRGAVRNRAAVLEAFDAGRRVMTAQRFDIESALVAGDRMALQLTWRGTLAVPLRSLKPGDTMTARFAAFFDVRDGKLARQENYDCFDAF